MHALELALGGDDQHFIARAKDVDLGHLAGAIEVLDVCRQHVGLFHLLAGLVLHLDRDRAVLRVNLFDGRLDLVFLGLGLVVGKGETDEEKCQNSRREIEPLHEQPLSQNKQAVVVPGAAPERGNCALSSGPRVGIRDSGD